MPLVLSAGCDCLGSANVTWGSWACRWFGWPLCLSKSETASKTETEIFHLTLLTFVKARVSKSVMPMTPCFLQYSSRLREER